MRAYTPPIEAGASAATVAGTFSARRALANNALWLLGSNLFYAACQWLTVVAVVKSRAPNALGHYGLASAVAAPIVVLSTMALRSYQATDVLRRYAFAEYLNLRLAANVVAGVAIAVAALTGAVPDGAASVLVPISVAKLVEVTCETCYGLAQRHDRIRMVALSQAARAAVGLGALVVVLALGGTLVAAVWALAGAWIAVLLAVDLPGAQALEPVLARPRAARLVSLARECLPLGAQSAVVALTQGLPRYLLQASHGAAAVGYFTALSGVTPALSQLASAVGQAAAPQLGWKAAGDMRSYRRLVFRLLGLAGALSAVLTLGAVLVGRSFLTLAYTADYADYETAFVLLVLGAGLSVVNTMSYFSLLAVRRHGLLLAMQCFGLLTTALTGAWLIPRFGLDGAAVAVALGGAASAAPGVHVLLRGQVARPARAKGLVGVLALLLFTATLTTAFAAESANPGTVRFAKGAASSFDRYTRAPTPAQQAWMQTHYWRMRAYSPYFDSRLAWFPKAWVYKDLYAIYTDSAMVDAHPDWILRDGGGNRLYIPYDCQGGTCPQYAADIGNPAFRADWIAAARATLGKGYVGLFVDDVNMDLSRVGNGSGSVVAPRDPRTGSAMTNADWRRYMAEFTEEIRRAFPSHEIVHNPLWFFGQDDPFIQRQLLSADCIEVERGVNDSGVRGGDGRYGFDRLLAYLDWVHARGKGIVFDAGAESDGGREYGLAAYFLVDAGRDSLGNDPGGTPDDWWGGYNIVLGPPAASRYAWRGVLRRDFEHGMVLVNPPDAPLRTLALDRPHIDLAGQQRTAVTLGPAEGAVLRSSLTAPRAIDIKPEVH